MSEYKEDYGEFDDLFRRKLENLHPDFEESAWEAMEAKLDAEMPANTHPKPTLGFWIWGKYLVAALFLGVVGFTYLYWPTQVTNENLSKSLKTNELPDNSNSNAQSNQKNSQKTDNQAIVDSNLDSESNSKSDSKSDSNSNSNSNLDSDSNDKKLQYADNQAIIKNKIKSGLENKNPQTIDNQLINSREKPDDKESINKYLDENSVNVIVQNDKETVKNNYSLIDNKLPEIQREKFAIGALNTKGFQTIQANFNPIELAENQVVTNSASNSPKSKRAIRLGLSAGMDMDKFTLDKNQNFSPNLSILAEINLLPKLTVLSGLQYNPKHYQVSDFLGGAKLLNNVRASSIPQLNTGSGFNFNGLSNFSQLYEGTKIKMELVDIPVEVRYYLGKKGRKGLFISAGVNSYIMFRQSFANDFKTEYFSDSNGDVLETEIFDVIDTRNYFFPFSHIQLGAGWEFNLNKKLSAQINPTFKTALRPIGLDNSQFSSVGIRTLWFLNF